MERWVVYIREQLKMFMGAGEQTRTYRVYGVATSEQLAEKKKHFREFRRNTIFI